MSTGDQFCTAVIYALSNIKKFILSTNQSVGKHCNTCTLNNTRSYTYHLSLPSHPTLMDIPGMRCYNIGHKTALANSCPVQLYVISYHGV